MYRFSVKKYGYILSGDQMCYQQFIVITDATGTVIKFTDYHKYIYSSLKRGAKHISDNGNNRFHFVAYFLNYVFFERVESYHLDSILHITLQMVQDFFHDYGTSGNRTKGTVDRCVVSIVDFLTAVIRMFPGQTTLKINDFTVEEIYRTKRGYTKTRCIPNFPIYYEKRKKKIFRDMPNSVFRLFLVYSAEHYQEIFFLIALSAFAGLRPSEACNVTRYNLHLFTIEGRLQSVEIDLTKERPLRSDLKYVGSIKKERVQKVYPKFIKQFEICHQYHLKYLENKPFEEMYAPLSINRSGKAYTYAAYYQRFKKFVLDIIPVLLRSEDPEVVEYGFALQEVQISPHIFRHWFSVQLTLDGQDIAGLQYWRGDKSPESALVYLQNKGELDKQLRYVSEFLFDFTAYEIENRMKEGDKWLRE